VLLWRKRKQLKTSKSITDVLIMPSTSWCCQDNQRSSVTEFGDVSLMKFWLVGNQAEAIIAPAGLIKHLSYFRRGGSISSGEMDE
jgi:hypothetical protein